MRGRYLILFLATLCASSPAILCRDAVVATEAPVECASSTSGPRLFTCAQREAALRAAGIEYEALAYFFPDSMVEHTMVQRAIEAVVRAKLPDARTRAMYWEELVARIDRRLGHAVSKSFRGLSADGGEEMFVFQGMKRFNGKAYLLVVLPDGDVLSGAVAPLEDLGNWIVHRGDLQRKRP